MVHKLRVFNTLAISALTRVMLQCRDNACDLNTV